jgi:hypothetical protein
MSLKFNWVLSFHLRTMFFERSPIGFPHKTSYYAVFSCCFFSPWLRCTPLCFPLLQSHLRTPYISRDINVMIRKVRIGSYKGSLWKTNIRCSYIRKMLEIRTEVCLLAKELWANSSNKDVRNCDDDNINNNSFLAYRSSGMRRCVAG